MSMGEGEHNHVQNVLGIGILCGNRSMCAIAKNGVVGTRADTSTGGETRAGLPIDVWFESEAELGTKELVRHKGGVGSFLGSTIDRHG
jgi:hypothetical protein